MYSAHEKHLRSVVDITPYSELFYCFCDTVWRSADSNPCWNLELTWLETLFFGLSTFLCVERISFIYLLRKSPWEKDVFYKWGLRINYIYTTSQKDTHITQLKHLQILFKIWCHLVLLALKSIKDVNYLCRIYWRWGNLVKRNKAKHSMAHLLSDKAFK